MAGLINNYAASLVERARKEGRLEEYHRAAQALLHGEETGSIDILEELRDFGQSVANTPAKPMLERFLELSREKLRMVDVEVISAVELTPEQLHRIECFMIQRVKKRVSIRTEVDPSILGGLRISVDNYVIDSSIKSQFEQIRKSLYEEVYFRHD